MTEITKGATNEWPKAMMEAVVSCPHSIDADEVRLLFDPKAAGHNALNQLSRRVSAALSTLPIAGEGKVKPLEWEVYPEDGGEMWEGQGEKRQYLFRALAPIGDAYFILRKDDLYSVTLTMIGQNIGGIYGTADEAKAAAQADYEARVRSALSTPADSEPCSWDCVDAPMGICPTSGKPCPVADSEPVSVPYGQRPDNLVATDTGMLVNGHYIYALEAALSVARIASAPQPNPSKVDAGDRKFNHGDRVTKTKGSSWTGRVVGFYSTELTPIGYAVESETERGSVQIYPESALAEAKGSGQ